MPPDKSKSPPDSSHLSNGLGSSALGERAELTTAQRREQTLATALRIAARGITKQDRESGRGRAVFPVRSSGPRAKLPYFAAKYSNGRPWGATTDPDLIRKYWKKYPDADIGMVTGDGLLVIDVDTIEGHGVDGPASLARLTERIDFCSTRVSQSQSGSTHHYFSYRPSPDLRIPTKPSHPNLGPGLDVKCDGGYVVVPSRWSYSKTERTWITHRDPGPASGELIYLVAEVRRSPSRRVSAATRPSLAASSTVIDPALADTMAADGGKGNSTDAADYFEEDDVPLKITFALAVIPADCSRETWWRVGAGIYDALGEEGFVIFDDWSSTAKGCTSKGEPVYTPEGTLRMWRECAKMRAIKVATVYGIANENDPDRNWLAAYRDEMRARRTK